METIDEILNDFCGILNESQRENIRLRVLKCAEFAEALRLAVPVSVETIHPPTGGK